MRENKKTDLIQIRLTKLEKDTIKQKAELLDMTITNYIKECCIFSSSTEIFMNKLHNKKQNA